MTIDVVVGRLAQLRLVFRTQLDFSCGCLHETAGKIVRAEVSEAGCAGGRACDGARHTGTAHPALIVGPKRGNWIAV